jgi:hypothetical protein
MTATKKTTTPKAKTNTAAKASNCMCKGDLIAIVAATLMAKGGLPTASALESAKYIAEAAHELA